MKLHEIDIHLTLNYLKIGGIFPKISQIFKLKRRQ